MSANTSIEWTDRSWNPVRGCSRVSEGCRHCYAERVAHRFSGSGKPYFGLTKQTKSGPQWTGKVELVESALLEPLSWRRPARVFVNSMSDLFHEEVPDWFIDSVFATMALAPRHTFQILTKRAERILKYFAAPGRDASVAVEVFKRFSVLAEADRKSRAAVKAWPLPNVWLGVSVEDQQRADERIPLLLQTTAAVRFISAEPLLGPVDLTNMIDCPHQGIDLPGLDWCIVGGESGPGARPFDLAWGRSIVEQCKAAGVACFMKQLGSKPNLTRSRASLAAGVSVECEHGFDVCPRCDAGTVPLRDRKGGDIDEWPADLRVREFPAVPA